MQNNRPSILPSVLSLLACLLVIKVTATVVLNYHNYFPPNFQSDFLKGRDPYFFGSYSWAFYAHIVSGPCSLILGLILISERFRNRFPKWHRVLGRIQTIGVLLLVAPSGLWMAYHAMTGTIAAIGFAALSLSTGLCTAMGWRSAIKRRFVEHRRWMWRCFLLLCSAVVLRLTAGFATVTELESEWAYPLAAWTSWLVPLLAFELITLKIKSHHRPKQ